MKIIDLITKYPENGYRIEKSAGIDSLCGGIIPKEELREGQFWVSTGGIVVQIVNVSSSPVDCWITYKYRDGVIHEKEQFAFQCRYFLTDLV